MICTVAKPFKVQFVWLAWALRTVLQHSTLPCPWHSWKSSDFVSTKSNCEKYVAMAAKCSTVFFFRCQLCLAAVWWWAGSIQLMRKSLRNENTVLEDAKIYWLLQPHKVGWKHKDFCPYLLVTGEGVCGMIISCISLEDSKTSAVILYCLYH